VTHTFAILGTMMHDGTDDASSQMSVTCIAGAEDQLCGWKEENFQEVAAKSTQQKPPEPSFATLTTLDADANTHVICRLVTGPDIMSVPALASYMHASLMDVFVDQMIW